MSWISRLRTGNPKSGREKSGLWELRLQKPNATGCVDIVAIHGFGGDAYGTWTHENGKLWLRDFLPLQIPEARVMTYGYNSVVAFSKSTAQVDDFARDFLQRVKGVRRSAEEKSRALVFICHSLGGILFKQALNIAHQDVKAYGELLAKFAGVAFMGTPHGGSDIAFWTSHASRLIHAATLGTRTNKDLLQVLRKDSEFLESLSKKFALQNQSLKILSFYETEKLSFMNCPIVEKDSAHLQLPNEDLIPIAADHRAMCRFSASESQMYLPVAEAIMNMTRDCENVTNTHSYRFSQFRSTLNKWLDPVAAVDDFVRIRSRRLEGSCTWVEGHPGYQRWMSKENGTLYLTGPPGCGKSTIVTRIIENLQTEYATAYFFCTFNDNYGDTRTSTQTRSRIFRTWTWQLLQQNDHLAEEVFNIYLETSEATTPLVAFERALELLLVKGKKCFLVLDGLDEAGGDALYDSDDLRSKFEKRAKTIITRREVPWRYLNGATLLMVNPTSNAVDIERYIVQEVQILASRLRLDPNASDAIVTCIIKGSSGMFIWARLMMELLAQQDTWAEIRSALANHPEGLDEMYTRLLQKIELLRPNRRRIASQILRWTLAAKRQLSLSELATALAVQPGSHYEDPENFLVNITVTVRETCGSFLEIDEAKGCVRFVHGSAVEFFKRPGHIRTLKIDGEACSLSHGTLDPYMASVCLTYLAYDNIDFVSSDVNATVYDENLAKHLAKNTFLDYCALSWWKHLPRKGHESGVESEKAKLKTSVERFCGSQKAVTKWLQLYQLLDGPRKGRYEELPFRPDGRDYVSTLHISGSCFPQLCNVPSTLFNRWDRWTAEKFFNGRHGSPIGIAAFFDFAELVRDELDNSSNVDIRDPIGCTPFLYAAHGDASNTLEYLLRRKADVRATTVGGFGAARFASRNCLSVLHQVLDAGAPIMSRDLHNGTTAIHGVCSSIGWHPMVLKELLEKCSSDDLNVIDYMGRTALHEIAAIDLRTSVNLVRNRLAPLPLGPFEREKHFSLAPAQEVMTPSSPEAITSLGAAWGVSLQGDKYDRLKSLALTIKSEIVQTLVVKGFPINTVDDFGQTALHLAIRNSSHSVYETLGDIKPDPIVELLMKHKSNLDHHDLKGQTPVDLALSGGHWSAAKALLGAYNLERTLPADTKLQLESLVNENATTQILPERRRDRIASTSRSPLQAFQVRFMIIKLLQSGRDKHREEDTLRRIASRIVDYAGFWASISKEFDLESNINMSSMSIPLRAALVSEVRKLKITVSRPSVSSGYKIKGGFVPYFNSRDIYPRSRPEERINAMPPKGSQKFGDDRSSSNTYLKSSASHGPMNGQPNSSHRHGSLLRLERRPGREVTGLVPSSQPATLDVSADLSLWELKRGGMHKYDSWVHTLSTEESETWIQNLKGGDCIHVTTQDGFSAQDIALFSRIRFRVFVALV